MKRSLKFYVLPLLLAAMVGCSDQSEDDAPQAAAPVETPAANAQTDDAATGASSANPESVVDDQNDAAVSQASHQVVVKHAQGETIVNGVPQKVFVTDWAAFDNLTALGVPVAGVPAGHLPAHLAGKLNPDAIKIGSLQEPDVEAIVAANPDLVLVGARSRTSYPTLSKLVTTIDTSVDNADIIGNLKSWLETYGKIFDKQERAAELIANLDAKVQEVRAVAQGKGTVLVIVTNGGRIGIYGPESRVSWIYNALGLPSVFDHVDDRDHGGDAINFEYLVKTNPDWLFVVDRDAGVGTGAAAAQALLDNALIRQADFWKNDRVVYLDPSAAYVTMHGYDAVMLLLDQVGQAFSTK